ncbi:MAG: cyclase [Tardiphaga sp.]|uniref:type II toxin-antitoxin system RatA family toxin n=1 Tax=Tardiphaga sp. TaxID=1926292 RepID=UPI00261064D8|nr:SRPBCC family protein [Tardiphaga sp.]MDB5502870.1 cyclase [Tardiphaga sp.]
MRQVDVLGKVAGLTCAEIYARLADFAIYPKYSPAVRSVVVSAGDDGRFYSEWEVSFREGILRWKEEDIFMPAAYRLRFSQIEGDIESFDGEWSVVADGPGGCLVRFSCAFDMGIPGLNDILEPIAEQALRDNARSIIKGLVPPVEFISAEDAA